MLVTARQRMERAFSHPPVSAGSDPTAASCLASVSTDARRAVSSMDLAKVLAPASVPKAAPSAAATDTSNCSATTGALPHKIPHRGARCSSCSKRCAYYPGPLHLSKRSAYSAYSAYSGQADLGNKRIANCISNAARVEELERSPSFASRRHVPFDLRARKFFEDARSLMTASVSSHGGVWLDTPAYLNGY
jgi:hypothetical protein